MRFTTSTKSLVVLAAVALLLPSMLLAQSTTQGAISGTVTDPTNAVLANTPVKLKNLDKGFEESTTTNGQGAYQFPLIAPGAYNIEITASGFKQFTAKTTVIVGQTTVLDAKLQPGAAGTTIEVSGAAPLVQTEAAELSTAFDQNLVANLPNGGNDLTAVAYTAPGVVMNSGGGYGNFNVNGLPATSNVFTVDGENQMDPFLNLNNSGPTNLMLGKNSIEEATVVSNAYSGQYGQQAGAQVSLVSKGGTNSFHGNVQYQWTGREMDANNWFDTFTTGTPQGTPFANNNQWAASFGGPFKKDKSFFFIDTEGIRYIVPSTQTVFTPTTGFLNDTIANLGVVGASAATIATYKSAASIWEAAPHFGSGAGLGAGSCVDPITGAVVDASPNVAAGCFQSYTASPALPANEWLLIGRFDQNFGSKDRAFFRWDIDRGTQATYADPISNQFSAASFQPEYNNSLNWSHAFSPTATNQFVAAISYYRAIFLENTNGPTSPFPYSLYMVATNPVNGLNADNLAFPQGRNVTQYQFVDDFAKTVGRHNLKFGANFRRYDITNYDQSEFITPEVVAFLGDFFNGGASEYFQNNPLHPTEPMNTGGIGVYAQDEWSIKPNLKVTLSLRAEHNFNPTCDIQCFTLLNGPFSAVQQQGAAAPYNQALLTGRTDAFNSVDSIDWSPRIGFTWSPRANGKTVISGGFGMFYDAFPAFITDQFVNLPYLVPVGLFGGEAFGVPTVTWGDPTGAQAKVNATANTIRNGNAALGIPSLANGLTAAGLLAAGGALPSVTGYPGNLKTPQYQEWNLQVQQQLDSKSMVAIAYVGNHGIHESYLDSTLNDAAGITGYPSAPPDSRFGNVSEWYPGAISNHNALTANYSRRLTVGFVINANYTWSHTLDEISNGGLLPYGANTDILSQANPVSLRANNYGNADYDVRHAFNANYVWTEPYHFTSKLAKGLLGGWMFSEAFVVRTGLPFTVTDGTTSIENSVPNQNTPAQVLGPGQGSCTNGFSQCFNSAEFAPATGLGFYPTQMRNQYRGPGFFDSDITIGKSFQLTERIKFTLGANYYNIFNHPNFQNPHNAWTSPTCSTPAAGSLQGGCGEITGSAAPPTGPYGSFFNGLPAGRVGQIQAKIVF